MRYYLLVLLWIISQTIVAQDYVKYAYKRISHKFDNYQTPEILEAVILINGEKIRFDWGKDSIGLGYPIPKEFFQQKVCIEINVPNYIALKADSALLGAYQSFYLLQKKEPYYIVNGLPVSLNYGREYLAIKIKQYNKISLTEAAEEVKRICQKYNWEIAYNYQDSIQKMEEKHGEGNTEKTFGCLGQELSYTFWLKRQNKQPFCEKSNRYQEIRKNEKVEWIGIPQNFHTNISNGIEIEFKAGTTKQAIDQLIQKYKLKGAAEKKDWNYYQGGIMYHFEVASLYPPNKLMHQLMKEAIVFLAQPKTIAYVMCC